LRSAALFEIRATIARGWESGVRSQESGVGCSAINVFVTCDSLELERLPWEAWEIGAEFPILGTIRIARTPNNIRHETGSKPQRYWRRKARVLVILGDDTGLSFQGDKEAVRSLSRIAEIQFVGWQSGQDIAEFKTIISQAIMDERGWDILFFAGHSSETILTGGELAIAPNVSMSIGEITPQLLLAKQRGLQFALFNSCSGLNIAASLIDLGLSQVAVMREPIHNSVAQVFLFKFLQGLAEYKDVHDALIAACQFLKLEKNLTYPSAYLIPSLFCHPDAVLFQIKPFGWKEWLKPILPTRIEAITLSVLTFLSLFPPVQDGLLEQRVLMQAVYRQITQQVPPVTPPPVLLVQIDNKSIQEGKIANPRPMNRNYLANLVDKLSVLNTRVVGIDYLLDRPHGESNKSNGISPDRQLFQAIQSAIQKPINPIQFVFASIKSNPEGSIDVLPEIASPNWSFQGYIDLLLWYMRLVPSASSKSESLPFAYLLALAYQHPTQPQLSSQTDFFSQLNRQLKTTKGLDYRTVFSPSSQLQPITKFSYYLGQMWLHPILDFSIPPERAYQSIPAWQLLKSTADSPHLRHVKQQVVIVAPGGYDEAEDNFTMPSAIGYWLKQRSQNPRRRFTGGEVHAYMVHHFLNKRLVVPIPDIWMIGVVVLLGKGTKLLFENHKNWQKGGIALVGITAIYGVVSLQVYISGAILLPWFLPSAMLGIYALPVVLRRRIKSELAGFYKKQDALNLLQK